MRLKIKGNYNSFNGDFECTVDDVGEVLGDLRATREKLEELFKRYYEDDETDQKASA